MLNCSHLRCNESDIICNFFENSTSFKNPNKILIKLFTLCIYNTLLSFTHMIYLLMLKIRGVPEKQCTKSKSKIFVPRSNQSVKLVSFVTQAFNLDFDT